MLNVNIPHFRCLVRRSWFTKTETDELDLCTAFAIQSVAGLILTFHVMTDYGMLRSRVPINEIFVSFDSTFKPKPQLPDFCQLWDCFGYEAVVIEYEYLFRKRCEIILKDKTKIWGSYMFTVDWHSNQYSETHYDYKCAHIINGDDGNIYAQPNNRILWKDPSFITNDFPLKNIKIDNQPVVSVESFSDRWVSEDSDCYYYDVNKLPCTEKL